MESIYNLIIMVCGLTLVFLFLMFIYNIYDYIKYKKTSISTIFYLILLGFTILILDTATKKKDKYYKEVYYLEYTIYYPNNKTTYIVDSCNHVVLSSMRGTNTIKYWSISKQDWYGNDTSAPIQINKLIRRSNQ